MAAFTWAVVLVLALLVVGHGALRPQLLNVRHGRLELDLGCGELRAHLRELSVALRRRLDVVAQAQKPGSI